MRFFLTAVFLLLCSVAVTADEFPYTQAIAEEGDTETIYFLGRMCDLIGKYNESLNWYHRAADQGHAEAQWELAYKYYAGEGGERDYTQAIKWYRKAADQGHPMSQWELGRMYYSGKGVPQNYAQAIKWYRKAADQGVPGVMTDLGSMYFNGLGVSKNFGDAYVWFSLSSTLADSDDSINRELAASRLSPPEISMAQNRSAKLFDDILQRRENRLRLDQELEERFDAAIHKEAEMSTRKMRTLVYGEPNCWERCGDLQTNDDFTFGDCDLACK